MEEQASIFSLAPTVSASSFDSYPSSVSSTSRTDATSMADVPHASRSSEPPHTSTLSDTETTLRYFTATTTTLPNTASSNSNDTSSSSSWTIAPCSLLQSVSFWIQLVLICRAMIMNAAITVFGLGIGVGLFLGDSFHCRSSTTTTDDAAGTMIMTEDENERQRSISPLYSPQGLEGEDATTNLQRMERVIVPTNKASSIEAPFGAAVRGQQVRLSASSARSLFRTRSCIQEAPLSRAARLLPSQ